MLDGKVLIDQVNELLGIHLENDEVDTIGGWFLTQKYDVEQYDSIIEEGCEFIINEIDYHVAYIEVKNWRLMNCWKPPNKRSITKACASDTDGKLFIVVQVFLKLFNSGIQLFCHASLSFGARSEKSSKNRLADDKPHFSLFKQRFSRRHAGTSGAFPIWAMVTTSFQRDVFRSSRAARKNPDNLSFLQKLNRRFNAARTDFHGQPGTRESSSKRPIHFF